MCQQLVRALVDPDVQERVLSRYAHTPEASLAVLVKFVEAQEMGKRSQGLLAGSSGGALNRITEYKSRSNVEKVHGKPSGPSASPDGACSHCGEVGHGPSSQEREKSCKAFGMSCNRCKRKGHMARYCQSKPKGKVAQLESGPSPVASEAGPPSSSPHKSLLWARLGAGLPSRAGPVQCPQRLLSWDNVRVWIIITSMARSGSVSQSSLIQCWVKSLWRWTLLPTALSTSSSPLILSLGLSRLLLTPGPRCWW
jgi:hypothetical protein